MDKDNLRDKSKSTNIGDNAVMASLTGVSVMIGRYTISIIARDTRVRDGAISRMGRGRGRRRGWGEKAR